MTVYSDIVLKLNEVVKASIKPYINGDTDTINLFGLANSYFINEYETAPMVNNGGELTYIYDLDYPITGYHKLNDSLLNLDKNKSFGNKKRISAKNILSTVIIGKRNAVTTDPETLALVICSQLFDTAIEAGAVKGFTMGTGFVTDQLAILKSEFQGKNYDFKYNNPDYFLIKVNYTLTLELVVNCLTC